MDEHRIEPELQRTPPRRVKRRGTRGYGTLISRIFLLPILALAPAFTLWDTHMALVRWKGPVVNCTITERYTKTDSDDGKTLHYLNYRFLIDGKPNTDRELVDEQTYAAISVGSIEKVQLSPLFPGQDSVLLLPDTEVWGIVWGFAFTSLILWGCEGMLLWYIYILPSRRRRLAIRGVPAVGRLIDKTVARNRSGYANGVMAYYFYYEYQTQPVITAFASAKEAGIASRTYTGKQSVRKSDWDAPQIGETYSVLYNPRQPEFSVLYLYGDYVVVD